MGSVRLEESGEWSGGVPKCRTAHAAHQQRVESGGRRPARSPGHLSFVFKAAKRIFAKEFARIRLPVVLSIHPFKTFCSPTVLCG